MSFNMFTFPLCVVTCFASFVLALLAFMRFVDASGRFDHPSPRRSRALAQYKLGSSGAMEESCTSGVRLKNYSILIELPRVSEFATNIWVFSKV